MSDFEDDLAISKIDYTTVRGSMCKIFKSKHKPERVFHKSMGVINPVHLFDDPRKNMPNIQIEPNTNEMTLFDFSLKYKEKSFLPEHLTHPFIYIEKVVPKDVNGYRTFYQHPDQWNTSNNCHSTRIQTQIPKKEMSDLTRSIVQSKREKGDRNDYEQNERMKRYIKFFFKNICQLLKERRFLPEVAQELMNPKSKLWNSGKDLKKKLAASKNKDAVNSTEGEGESTKNKKQDAGTKPILSKEFVELDRDYTLREIWKAYCIVKKLDFKNDDQEIVDQSVFCNFVKGLGYLEKKWKEIDKYFDYCNKKEDVGLVHPSEFDEKIHRDASSPSKENHDAAAEHEDHGNSPLKTKSDFMKNSSLLQWRPALKKLQKSTFSMRAFVFNYEKFLKDSEKVSYVLSVRAATERRVGLKYYVQNYFVKLTLLILSFKSLIHSNINQSKGTFIIYYFI